MFSSDSESLEPRDRASCAFVTGTIIWVAVMLGATALVAVYSIAKVADDTCSHGTALPGDVTAPSDPSFGDVVAIVYGFVPYACGVVCLVLWVFRKTAWPLLILVMAGAIVVLNEGVIKRLVSQARPSGSCLHSSGMPSSHSELSIGFWVYFQLEVFIKGTLTSTAEWTRMKKGVVVLAVYVLLLPVPFTRVVLHDHSWAQVGVGALIGSAVALLWFVFMNCFLFKHLDKLCDVLAMCPCCWGEGLFSGFVNDYYPAPSREHRTDMQISLRHDRYPDPNHEDSTLLYSGRLAPREARDWFQGVPQALDIGPVQSYGASTEDSTQSAIRNGTPIAL